jgi:hypothetical protein
MRVFRNALLASLAATATAGSALASIPAVSVRIEQVGTGSLTLSPAANPIEGGYGYSADLNVWGFQSSFTLNSTTTAGTDNNSFGGAFRLKNTTGATQQFIIDMTVTNDPFSGNALAGGSVGGTLLGGPVGGLFSGVGNGSIWQAIINRPEGSSTIASLLTGNPFTITTAADASASIARQFFGNDPFIPSQPIGSLGTSRTIRMQFLLGAGSDVTLLTNFVVQVPAPGAIALLGLSGLVGRRRRA